MSKGASANAEAKNEGYGVREALPWWLFNAELKLPDGRLVMGYANAGLQMSMPSSGSPSVPKGLQVQVMDRDGPHGPVCVINDSTVNPFAVWSSCDPLLITAKTRVTHPQSADETLRNGYLRHAPSNINGDFSRASICQCLLGVPTCCVGAMLLSCCWSPVLNYQLQEVRSGSAVQGVRYTEKDKSAL